MFSQILDARKLFCMLSVDLYASFTYISETFTMYILAIAEKYLKAHIEYLFMLNVCKAAKINYETFKF